MGAEVSASLLGHLDANPQRSHGKPITFKNSKHQFATSDRFIKYAEVQIVTDRDIPLRNCLRPMYLGPKMGSG